MPRAKLVTNLPPPAFTIGGGVEKPQGESPWRSVVRGDFRMPKGKVYLSYDELFSPDGTSKALEGAAGRAIRERYGKRPLDQTAAAIMNDMGIGAYKAVLDTNADLTKDQASGRWDSDIGTLQIDKQYQKESPWKAPTTAYHELAHIADDIAYPGHAGAAEPGYGSDFITGKTLPLTAPSHFVNFKNRDSLLGDLDEQSRIEHGETPNKALLDAHPWLKKVAPLSSNMLASPWREQLGTATAQRPEYWNMRMALKNPGAFPSETKGQETVRPELFQRVHDTFGRRMKKEEK